VAERAKSPHVPDLAVFRIEVVGVEFELVKRLAAAGTKVVVLATAVDLHEHILESGIWIQALATLPAASSAIDQTLPDPILLGTRKLLQLFFSRLPAALL